MVFELNQYHAIRAGSKINEIRKKRKRIWGEPKSLKDISNVFVSFCTFHRPAKNNIFCHVRGRNRTTRPYE